MKVILSYGNYFNHGKQYQAKFIYDNANESENVETCIINLGSDLLKPYQEKFIKTPKTKPINVIGGTNIPADTLLPFINELLAIKNTTIVIGSQEFTKDNIDSIEDAIDTLHLNVTLQKGKYFGLGDCYYVKFKYASDEQRTEVSYDFNVNLNVLTGKDYSSENDNYIFPFIVDRNGKITTQNTGIIGGTNIPKQAIPFFLLRFINEYNAIVTIGNEKFKKYLDSKRTIQALSELESGRARTHKPNAKK